MPVRRAMRGAGAAALWARVWISVWVWTAATAAAQTPGGVRAPVRLTAGASDEFLGSADGDGTLYFVSNRNATTQIFSQRPGGSPRLFVDEGADVSFPRPSPDGKWLAYISTRGDAMGDLCLRALPGGERRCLTGPTSAEMTAFWFPDGQSLGVVQRLGIHGDLELRRLDTAGQPSGERVPDTGVLSPAVHPGSAWLAWVPVTRASQDVGVAFAMRPAEHLRLARLGRPGHQDVVLQLPGVTGFPAFSRDGHFLYFAQHLSDTNLDGRIDGHDHSVLFRIAFDATAERPLAGAVPQQLTSARWNCQYPAPAADTLYTTCDVDGSLDVYRLPLDGALAADWPESKLREVLEVSRDPWQRLLVLSHLRHRTAIPEDRTRFLREMTRVHLQLGELASAQFLAGQAVQSAPRDAAVAEWAAVVQELIGHRLDERRLAGGKLDDRFLAAQKDRLRRLGRLGRDSAAVRDFARLAQAEILDVMGEEARALAALGALTLPKVSDTFVLLAFADSGIHLLRSLGRQPELLEALRQLAEHPLLEGVERLDLADRLVAELERGIGTSDQQRLLATWLPKAEREGELAFRLELESHVVGLTPQLQEPVRAALFKLYKHHNQPERRRVLVAVASRRAAEADCADLLYAFANTWSSEVDARHAEREAAVHLYRQVGLDRAWILLADEQTPAARGTFWGVTLQSVDLEAHAGFIEARLAERQNDVAELYAKRFGSEDPLRHVATAWLLARDLGKLADPAAQADALDLAEHHADAAAQALTQNPGLFQLRGFLRHQRFLLLGDRQAGVAALDFYQMARDLAAGRPRYQAALLGNQGSLQAALGNHALALGLVEERRRLPIRGPAEDLALRLTRARALLVAGRRDEAHDEAEVALALAETRTELADVRDLARDRCALTAYAVGQSARAVTLYRGLLAQPPDPADPQLAAANRLRWTLMAAAASAQSGDHPAALGAIADARAQLAALDGGALARGAAVTSRRPPLTAEDYALLLDGLTAVSASRVGDAPSARAALLARKDGLGRVRADDAELELDLAGNALRLAELERENGNPEAALAQLEAGLRHARSFEKINGSVAPDARVALLRAYAEGLMSGKLPAGEGVANFVADLRAVYDFLCSRANPNRLQERFLLGLYLCLFDLQLPPHVPARQGTP